MRFRWVVTSKPEYRGAEAGAAQRERHDGTDGAAGRRSCVQPAPINRDERRSTRHPPPIASNSFIQGLKAELAGLQRERAQLAERLELHPDMIKMDTAIASAEGRLKAETDKVVASIRNDFSTAQARERALIAALDAQKREVLELNQQSIGYGALQRDAASTQQIFESVLQRLKETELSGELKSNNVRIVDMAAVPRVPIRPRKLVNVLVALVGGVYCPCASDWARAAESANERSGAYFRHAWIATSRNRSKNRCVQKGTSFGPQNASGVQRSTSSSPHEGSFYRRLPTSRRWR